MTDSPRPDRPTEASDWIPPDRLEAIRRWAAYIEEHPPEVWGPQQNAVVDSQLESAQQTGLSAEHERHVREVARRLTEE